MFLVGERNQTDTDHVLSRTNIGRIVARTRSVGTLCARDLHSLFGGLSLETDACHEQNHNGSHLCPHCQADSGGMRRVWWWGKRYQHEFAMGQLCHNLSFIGLCRVRLLGRIYQRGIRSNQTRRALQSLSVERKQCRRGLWSGRKGGWSPIQGGTTPQSRYRHRDPKKEYNNSCQCSIRASNVEATQQTGMMGKTKNDSNALVVRARHIALFWEILHTCNSIKWSLYDTESP